MALLAAGAFANQAVAQKTCKATECDKAKTECKAECKTQCRLGGDSARKAQLFEGITLTSEQQTRIEALDNAMKTSRQEMREQAKQGDKAAKKDMKEQAKQLRRKYVDDMGEILTSDQMVVYLKNAYVNQGSDKGPQMKKGEGRPQFDKKNARIVKANADFKNGKGDKSGKKDKR